MRKVFEGSVMSVGMQKTAVVIIQSNVEHPLYKKLMKRSKKVKVDTGSLSVEVGNKVRFVETRPISKDKHFKILEVVKDGTA